MPQFVAATYNVAAFKRSSLFTDDVDELLSLVDVIAFQEYGAEDDREQLERAARKHGFKIFRGRDVSLPIAWRASEFERLDSGSKFLSPRTRVGDAGAGPTVLKEKHLVWVKLRHKATGRVIYFANCHLAPSIYIRVRRLLHIRQTDGIREWARRKGNVVILGDFNIDYAEDRRQKSSKMPYVKFGRVGIYSTYRVLGLPGRGTHENRHIDYAYFRRGLRRLKPISHKVLTGFSSDHRPLLATFEVKRRLFRS